MNQAIGQEDLIDSTLTSYKGLFVKARTHQAAIDIRWAPNDPLLFRIANKKGYRLERWDPVTNLWTILLDRGPYDVETFKAKLDTTNVHVATAAQCVYGAPVAPTNPTDFLGAAKEIEEEQKMRHGFALLAADYNKQAAEGLALAYRDTDIELGKNYIYRLYIRDMDDTHPKVDTASFLVNTNLIYQSPPVDNLTATAEPNQILLKWPKEENNQFFSGYFIEKSTDGGKTFKRINELPMVTSDHEDFDQFNLFHIYSDKEIAAEKEYNYRVIGINPFGEEGLPSEVVQVVSLDFSAPLPPKNVEARDIGNNKIRITWEVDEISSDQAGFAVWRADQPQGPFYPIHEQLLPTTARSYEDITPLPIQANYYIIYAYDINGNRNGSGLTMAVWYDTIPPAQPKGLAGFIDTTGLVTLAWAYGEEPDLNGYMVYWSNGPDREYYPISKAPIKGNIFLDSIDLANTSEDIYYKIIAVDFNMNQSIPSDPLQLQKPDINPPAAPLLVDYKAYADSIYIQWNPSPSIDVVAYQILRKSSPEEKYDILATIQDPKSTTYTDKSIARGQAYWYAIVAIDDALNYSTISDPYQITALRGMKRQPIRDLNGNIIESTAEFELTWTHRDNGEYHYVIYRNIDNEGWQSIATVDKNKQLFVDRNLFRAKTGFKYAIKVVYKDGGESPLSNIVALNTRAN